MHVVSFRLPAMRGCAPGILPDSWVHLWFCANIQTPSIDSFQIMDHIYSCLSESIQIFCMREQPELMVFNNLFDPLRRADQIMEIQKGDFSLHAAMAHADDFDIRSLDQNGRDAPHTPLLWRKPGLDQ